MTSEIRYVPTNAERRAQRAERMKCVAGGAIIIAAIVAAAVLLSGCASIPFVGGGGVDPVKEERASFLFDNAKTRAMNVLSEHVADASFNGILNRQKANGDKTAWLYVANEKDGPTVRMYTGSYGGAVDQNRVKAMHKRIETYTKKGFQVVLWLTADDSRGISGASRAQHIAHCNAAFKAFDDLASGYCVGLEMNEDGRGAHAAAMIAEMKKLVKGKKPVGVHLTTGKAGEAVAWGADRLYFQSGFGKSPAQVASMVRGAVGAVGGKCDVVSAEYHMSSDSAQAKAIGQACMGVKGCVGTGNGR